MTSWLLTPRDSLMLQDGRPCYLGQSQRSLDFPWPSTLAGFVRRLAGLDPQGKFTLSSEDARQIAIQGAFLVERSDAQAAPILYAPAPQDALWHSNEDDPKSIIRYRLAPEDPSAEQDCFHDLQGSGLALLDLVLGGKERPKGKVHSGAPFWRWSDLEAWLVKPPSQPDPPQKKSSFGLASLQRERRSHTSIKPDTLTADDGKLFDTEMLRFVLREKDDTSETTRHRQLGLAFSCDDPRLQKDTYLGCFGGERRLSFVEKLAPAQNPLPAFPSSFPKDKRLLRVVLLTPGIFKGGFRPSNPPGAKLVAAAVGRPSIISGWDMEKRQPKATRRMVNAGSVYWFQLDQGVDPVAWAKGLWLQSLCEDPQDKRDGFGLCAVGVA